MTSDHKTAKVLRALFHDQLIPVADRMKEGGVELLATGYDKNAASYYINRTKRCMEQADFEWGGCSVESFPEQLAELWRSQGHEGLAALAPALGKLAAALQDEDDQDGEVSPFIYVMY